jgi:hypothetical protein
LSLVERKMKKNFEGEKKVMPAELQREGGEIF